MNEYQYQLQDVTGVIGEGTIKVLPNFALADESESVKSHARQMLEAIEAVIEGKASAAQSAVTVDGKSIQYMPIADLLRLREYFYNKVAEEEGRSAKSSQKTIMYHWRGF